MRSWGRGSKPSEAHEQVFYKAPTPFSAKCATEILLSLFGLSIILAVRLTLPRFLVQQARINQSCLHSITLAASMEFNMCVCKVWCTHNLNVHVCTVITYFSSYYVLWHKSWTSRYHAQLHTLLNLYTLDATCKITSEITDFWEALQLCNLEYPSCQTNAIYFKQFADKYRWRPIPRINDDHYHTFIRGTIVRPLPYLNNARSSDDSFIIW